MRKLNFKDNPQLIDEIIDGLSEDASLKPFFLEHDIDTTTIEDALADLLTYKKEIKYCQPCKGLHQCQQDTLGMKPVLQYQGGKIRLEYVACTYLQAKENRQISKRRINALHMPKMIFEATLKDYYMNSDVRKKIYQKIIGIANQYVKGEKVKGLYIHGRYQIGKTYTLAAIANHFSDQGYGVTIAYYPDLVRELKSAIKEGSLEDRIQALKNVDVLCLDDMGGEAYSAWIRDEVLGPILQYRLLDEKLTFFTSNVPLQDLTSYYVESEQQQEKIKGFRIIERIKHLSEVINMK